MTKSSTDITMETMDHPLGKKIWFCPVKAMDYRNIKIYEIRERIYKNVHYYLILIFLPGLLLHQIVLKEELDSLSGLFKDKCLFLIDEEKVTWKST